MIQPACHFCNVSKRLLCPVYFSQQVHSSVFFCGAVGVCAADALFAAKRYAPVKALRMDGFRSVLTTEQS